MPSPSLPPPCPRPGIFLAVGAAGLLLCASTGRGQLVWEQTVREFQKTPADKHVETSFPFRNGGDAAVTITSVQTSCGCTTARLAKKTYAPGERGQVDVTYNFAGRAGSLRKTIVVSTDARPQQPALLEVRVAVAEPLQVGPTLVYWRIGAENAPKTVRLTTAAGQGPVRIASVASSNPRIGASLQTVKEGEEYTIQIAPVDTTQKESAQIRVVTDVPADAPRDYTIYALVK